MLSVVLQLTLPIVPISLMWNDLGRELYISLDYREQLRRDVSLSTKNKLERILSKWMDSESRPVTWSTLVEALEAIECKDIASQVKDFLKTPEAIQSYGKYTDHTPC